MVAKRESDPKAVEKRPRFDERACGGHGRLLEDGVPTLDYGNNIRQVAKDEGLADAFRLPGFVPAYIRPLFCRGIGPSAGARCRVIQRTSARPMRR